MQRVLKIEHFISIDCDYWKYVPFSKKGLIQNTLHYFSMSNIWVIIEVLQYTGIIYNKLVNKQILITGAGGSIGSELCRQLITLSPKTLILIDNCEYNLFNIEEELKNLLKNKNGRRIIKAEA